MAKFFKSSFNKMRFNPMCDGKMLETYADLTEIISPEWAQDPLLDKILRYVLLCYDPNSAVYASESDMNIRRGVASSLCGLNNEGPDVLMSIYRHEYVFINGDEEELQKPIRYIPELTMRYLKRFPRTKEHAAIVAMEFKFWENIMKTMEPITGKSTKEELEAAQKKGLMADEIEKDITRINAYYNNFYGGDEDLADIQQENRPRKRTPESVSNNIKVKS